MLNMKSYNYKIQWLFRIGEVYNGTFSRLLNMIGVQSLDKIVLKDIDLEILDEYTDFKSSEYTEDVEKKAIKDIKKLIRNNDKCMFVEVVKQ